MTDQTNPINPVDAADDVDFDGIVTDADLPPQTEEGPDPFDPQAHAHAATLDEDFAVEAVLDVLSCRKPDKAWWFRSHPDPAFRAVVTLLKDPDQGSMLLVAPALVPQVTLQLPQYVAAYSVTLCVNRQSVPFLFPVPVQKEGTREHKAHAQQREAVVCARDLWTLLVWDQSKRAYIRKIAKSLSETPQWPKDMSMRDLLKLAFSDELVTSMDHPAIRTLMGK